MLRIKNLESGYGNLRVLKGISMHVNPGEIVTIIGANGAGKTTLLHSISGLLKARSGEILFDKQDLLRLTPEKIVFMGCSLVPEGRQIFATMSVQENLLLGGYVQFRRKKRRRCGRTSKGCIPCSRGSGRGKNSLQGPSREGNSRCSRSGGRLWPGPNSS